MSKFNVSQAMVQAFSAPNWWVTPFDKVLFACLFL